MFVFLLLLTLNTKHSHEYIPSCPFWGGTSDHHLSRDLVGRNGRKCTIYLVQNPEGRPQILNLGDSLSHFTRTHLIMYIFFFGEAKKNITMVRRRLSLRLGVSKTLFCVIEVFHFAKSRFADNPTSVNRHRTSCSFDFRNNY